MKRTFVILVMMFFFSGCTVAHFTYIRNLTEHVLEITFEFSDAAAPSLPDSMYLPCSSSPHMVNNNTYTYMTDSVVVRKTGLKRMKLIMNGGQMIMLDKNASKKVGYHNPLVVLIDDPGMGVKREVVFSAPKGDQKEFKSKGRFGSIRWFDVY